MVDQLPCGSVLTPDISCKKFKIHSAHADTPMAETFFSLQILRRTSLCFTNQETQEENMHGGPTPFWVSTYTSYLLYKVQDPFSACRHSHGRNVFFLFRFYGGPVFASQTKKLRKRICMVDQLPSGSVLTPAISCTKFKIHSAHADTPMAETFFFLFRFYRGLVFASQTKKLRKRICMVDQLPCGSVLTPAISCTKFKINSAHADSPMAETFFSSSDFFRKDQSLLHRPRNSGRE